MIALNRIQYNKFSSVDFDLLCDVAFDSDNGECDSFLSREAVSSESYKGDFKRVNSFKYSNILSPSFTFVKRDFSDFTFE